MIREIYAKKIGMTQIFSEEGALISTTLLQVDPVCILEKVEYQNKSMAKIGCFKLEGKKAAKIKKPVKGYFDKLAVETYKLIREVEIDSDADFSFLSRSTQPALDGQAEKAPEADSAANLSEEGSKVGIASQTDSPGRDVPVDKRYVGIEMFAEGDTVDAQSVTKGRGFAGGVKRHGWSGQPQSHGSMTHRRVGSVGASAYPSRIIKGLHMPGHMGNVKRTTKKLTIVKIDKEKKLLFVKGSMPGARGAVVKLKKIND